MESLGEKLKTAREAKGLDYDKVSRDTNISIRYLEALETEYFDSFPGEPYITGFLKTYGSYLDLDVTELISLYRALRIQEQPVPVEALLKKPSPLPRIALVAAIILVVGGLSWGITHFISTRPERSESQTIVKRTAVESKMDSGILENRFYLGDTILVSVGSEQYKLELGNFSDVITIRTPGGFERLELGKSVNIDLNMNGIDDITITAVDFVKNKADMGARLKLEYASVFPVQTASINDEIPADTEINAASSIVIISSPNPYPFTLQSNFQGYCLFRWEILRERDRRERNEQYFQRGAELSIYAQNGIRVWASNAQAAKLQIIGGGQTKSVEFGGAGEIVVADIHWVRDEDNRYRLKLVRLES